MVPINRSIIIIVTQNNTYVVCLQRFSDSTQLKKYSLTVL